MGRIALHGFGNNPQGWFGWLAERLPLHGEVLEVGAGTGKLWSEVDPAGVRLTLTDFSAAMCEQLRAVPGARIQQCDATNLPFDVASFDGLIANHMLYHLDDPTVALREFSRVLRSGGRLAAALNGRDHLAELRALGPAIGRPELLRGLVVNDLVAENAADTFSRFFDDVAVERYPSELEVPAVEPILEYLATLAGEPLAPAEQSAVRELVQATIDAEGNFRIRPHSVLVTATR